MKIVIVAGGTGGHLYPGIALARALVNQDVSFVVCRGDLGKDVLKQEGFRVHEISGQGLPRSFSIKTLMFPIKLIMGIIEAIAFCICHRPDWVVGMGGYVSVPLVVMGRLFGVRVLLHEQNVYPGLANRILSRWVNSVAVSFPESVAYFPAKKTWVSGLPVRAEIGQVDQTTGRRTFGLDMQKPTYLVFGGSLGAVALNSVVLAAWPLLLQKGNVFQVIHVTGKADFERVQKLYQALTLPVKVLPYCHQMAEAYAAADVVISRAGASTVAELLLANKRALLVPYPHASNDHQTLNASVLQNAGLGQKVQDHELTLGVLMTFLLQKSSTTAPSELREAISGAAMRLANHLTSNAG